MWVNTNDLEILWTRFLNRRLTFTIGISETWEKRHQAMTSVEMETDVE
ncbi:hypothetical protein UC8_33050 [Roseimaritima ulvae]|uniref:Uncharacterized protein n=1 Tax=Roseimaritima ulvae TaxID=980254 RepID=A0A5B9QW14_9BACT|nr:hypothetical protein UC8_33050 [Roseimaritima ulvae]